MSPEQVSALTAIAAILSKVGTWPIGSIIVAVLLSPWFILIMVSRSMEKRHEAALEMYKHNVKLVDCYEKMAAEQADTIRLATSATVELTTWLKGRTPCHKFLSGKDGQR